MTQDTGAETRQTIRLPGRILTRLRAAAERDHRSVHSMMLVYIERGLTADERKLSRSGRGEGQR